MKILLTGATGFVGGYLMRSFVAAGHSVRATVRSGEGAAVARKAGAEPFTADLLDPGLIGECVKGMDAVVHCGGLPSEAEEELFFRANTLGTFLLLEKARLEGVKQFIFISSILVYGLENPLYLPVDEKHPLLPRDQAGACKAAAESYCYYYGIRYGMKTTVFRLAAVFGEKRKKHHTWPEIIEQARAGKEMKFPKGSGIMVVSAEDTANAVFLRLEKGGPAGGVYNLVDFYLENAEGARMIAGLGNFSCAVSEYEAGVKPFMISNKKLTDESGFKFSGREHLKRYFNYLILDKNS